MIRDGWHLFRTLWREEAFTRWNALVLGFGLGFILGSHLAIVVLVALLIAGAE